VRDKDEENSPCKDDLKALHDAIARVGAASGQRAAKFASFVTIILVKLITKMPVGS